MLTVKLTSVLPLPPSLLGDRRARTIRLLSPCFFFLPWHSLLVALSSTFHYSAMAESPWRRLPHSTQKANWASLPDALISMYDHNHNPQHQHCSPAHYPGCHHGHIDRIDEAAPCTSGSQQGWCLHHNSNIMVHCCSGLTTLCFPTGAYPGNNLSPASSTLGEYVRLQPTSCPWPLGAWPTSDW
jgi:hypothetical protein